MRGPILLTLLLGGCAGAIDAPSLAPRAVERQPIEVPGEPVEPETTADPALPVRLSDIVAAAVKGDTAFRKERTETETAVARAAGAAVGSDRWLTAQQALSALEAALGPARQAAAAVDALRADPANAAPGNRAAIDTSAGQIEALAEAQQAAVTALAARLS